MKERTAMRKSFAKLHSTRGASLIIALIFFLVCLTLGVVCLGAASANVGRLSHLRADQTSYLSVRSAATLVRDDMAGVSYKIIETTVGEGAPQLTYEPNDTAFESSLYLYRLLAALTQKAYANEAGPDKEVKLTLTFAESNIQAILSMQNAEAENRYSMDVAFYIPGDDPQSRESLMRLYIPASVRERRDVSRSGGVTTVAQVTAIVWGKGTLTTAEEWTEGGAG